LTLILRMATLPETREASMKTKPTPKQRNLISDAIKDKLGIAAMFMKHDPDMITDEVVDEFYEQIISSKVEKAGKYDYRDIKGKQYSMKIGGWHPNFTKVLEAAQ